MTFRLSLLLCLLCSLLLCLAAAYLGWSYYWLLVPLHVFIGLCVYGSIRIEADFYFRSVHTVSAAADKALCLTFDDGPHPEVTPRILDILNARQIPAVFFVIGKNIQGREAILQRMIAEGHQIGNHSYSHHALFDLQTPAAMAGEIRRTNALIEAVTGRKVTLFRPPYGVTNPMLASAVRQTGMVSVGWSLRSFDTVAKSEQALLQKLLAETRPGNIILLHDRCEITARVLTDYIDEALRRGYTFVPFNANA